MSATVIRKLRRDLTDEERIKMGVLITEELTAIAETEDELKSVSATMKATIKSAQAHIQELSNTLTKGSKIADVECIVDIDWTEGKKRTIRTDTSEIIETVDVTNEERQTNLLEQAQDGGDPAPADQTLTPDEAGEMIMGDKPETV